MRSPEFIVRARVRLSGEKWEEADTPFSVEAKARLYARKLLALEERTVRNQHTQDRVRDVTLMRDGRRIPLF